MATAKWDSSTSSASTGSARNASQAADAHGGQHRLQPKVSAFISRSSVPQGGAQSP